ncbi:MAG TPA: hypothetical protein VKA88_03125 [Solirubrobacterales bacterium]|nr:hypothetical protein [Solirubrobacterales bacterium]
MEASEKPQLPLQPDGSDGAVRAIGDRLVIERLEVNDPGAARVVQEQVTEGHAPAETVTRAIEIGTRVIESEGTAANVDYVKAELERQLRPLADRLGGVIEEGHEEFAERLARSFDRERSGSVQQQIRDMLITAMEHQRTQLAKQFSAQDGANPLADFKDGVVRAVKNAQDAQEAERARDRERIEALTTEITALRERLGAKEELEAEQSRGTAKGRDFEERVHALLDEIATARGDIAHHVGDLPGETRGKKGDTVIELGAGCGPCLAKIAFDPKDSRLTRPQAWDVLNGSLDDRGADYAVLVVASEENVPARTQSLVEYEGNKLIVAVGREDPERNILQAAYGIARARALAARQDELALDAPAMKEAIEETRRALESLKTARQALTGVRKNADSIESALAGMEETAKAALARADSLIADALEAAT